jgi:uncharacterized protein involved in exopolysaccharide biosynthesis
VALRAEVARLQRQQQAASTLAAEKDSHNAGTGKNSASPPIPVTSELLQERGKISMLQAQLAGIKRDIEFNEAERQRVVQQINAAQARVEQLPMVEQQMVGLTRDYETSKANYKSLLDKQIAAQMSTDMERRQKSERFEIIDPARVPEKPVKPNRPLFAGIGILASVVIGLAIGFAVEFRRPVLLGEWELPEGVAILGRVPIIQIGVKARSNRPWALRVVNGLPGLMAVISALGASKGRP